MVRNQTGRPPARTRRRPRCKSPWQRRAKRTLADLPGPFERHPTYNLRLPRGCRSMAGLQFPILIMRVRFPPAAPQQFENWRPLFDATCTSTAPTSDRRETFASLKAVEPVVVRRT